jgi:hypothetical protein
VITATIFIIPENLTLTLMCQSKLLGFGAPHIGPSRQKSEITCTWENIIVSLHDKSLWRVPMFSPVTDSIAYTTDICTLAN